MDLHIDSKSESAHGFFTLVTNKQVYYPGETVYGQVIMRVTKQLKEVGSLCMEFKGKETMKFLTRCKQFNSVENQRALVNDKLVICQFDRSHLAEKDYSFIFNYTIPKEQSVIPASFNYKRDADHGKSKFRIRYKMLVYISKPLPAENDNVFICKKRIFIAKCPYNPRNNFIEQSSQAVSRVGKYISAGVSKLDCKFERNFYIVNESAKVFCNCDNSQCSASIKKISISLVRTIQFSGYPLIFNNQTGNNIQTFSFQEIVAQSEIDGVNAYHQPLSEDQFDHQLTVFLDDYKSEFIQKREKKQKLWSPEDLRFTKFIQPTTHGQTFQCSYSIVVNREASTLFNSLQGVNVGITLNPCQEQVSGYVNNLLVKDWNPKVVDLRYDQTRQRYISGYHRQINVSNMPSQEEFITKNGENLRLDEDDRNLENDEIHEARRPFLEGFENE